MQSRRVVQFQAYQEKFEDYRQSERDHDGQLTRYCTNVKSMAKSMAQAYLAHQSAYATFGDTTCSANQHLRVLTISDIHLITTSPEALLRSLYQMDTLSFRRYYCGAPQIRPRRSMEIKPKKLQLANLRIPEAQSMKATMASHATEWLAPSVAMKQRRAIQDAYRGEANVG